LSQSATPRVLVCDELDPAALETFRERGIEPEVATGLSQEALIERAAEVDALIVRSATSITRPIIEAANRLQVIGRAGIGTDNIDSDAATERGIIVMNTPMGNATTTAELALALMLSIARHIPRADRRVRGGEWKKKGLLGTEITGKTLGVIGMGRIGRIVAEKARGLGMNIVAHDPYLAGIHGEGPFQGIDLLPLDELLPRVDFLSLHVPLTDATRNLISWDQLARIKPGARLINASRGGVVDEEAVLDALANGRLAGAAFDVLEQEPPSPSYPLLARDDVIVTPHLGASSTEAQQRVAVDIARQVSAFLLDGIAENAVNAPTIPADERRELAPYLLLAEKMGSFVAQRVNGPIRKLEFTAGGDIPVRGLPHLRLALLVGILRHSLETGVNFVNAPSLAAERGILMLESEGQKARYPQGQLEVTASHRAGELGHNVVGTVFGREPRFVRIDEASLDLPPRGALLLTRHQDRPGVFGQLGVLLGEHGINIARLELQNAPDDGGEALAFLSLDPAPDEAVLASVRALDAISEATLVQF